MWCWLPICRCLLQPELDAVQQEVAWLCAAAGQELVGRPATTDRLLSQDLVVVDRPRRQWAWDPFVYELATTGVSRGGTLQKLRSEGVPGNKMQPGNKVHLHPDQVSDVAQAPKHV